MLARPLTISAIVTGLLAMISAAAAAQGDPERGQQGPLNTAGQGGMMGGGMAQSSDMPDLKAVGPEQQVTAIRYCGDTYHVTTVAGETIAFWEFNLRFKTDSSENGPGERRPALLPASSMGDRAFVVFAHPAEISPFIEKRC